MVPCHVLARTGAARRLVTRGTEERKPSSSAAGIAIGPGLEIPFLLVDQGVQHLAHHFQMVAMPRKLALQIDEIGRRGVKSIRQEARNQP